MKILGITLAYNEADCIETAMKMLLRCCDSVIVFDHGSTDATAVIVLSTVGVHKIYLHRHEVPAITSDGRQSVAAWRFVAQWILQRQVCFDWVVWIDADEILRTPEGALPCKADIEGEAVNGIQVIRPLIREFCMTENESNGDSYLQRLRYFKPNALGHAPRAWQIDLTPKDVPPGRHIQDMTTGSLVHPFYIKWPEGTKVSNNLWLLDHYPFRSQDQATRKVLEDRNWITPLKQRKYYNYIHGKTVDVIQSTRRLTYMNETLEMP